MQWIRAGGPVAIKTILDAGEEPDPADMPPALGWEAPLWQLYQTLRNQWRVGFNGPVGLDLNVFLPVIVQRGWDVDLSLELLGVIEDEMLVKNE